MDRDETGCNDNTTEVVVVGSCMIDFVGYAPRLPKPGETIHGTEFVTNFGGKGANQCVAAAKLGLSTALVARVGDDTWGNKYMNNLIKNEVDTSFVFRTPGESTGIAQICVAQCGENQILIIPGANDKLNVDDISEASTCIENAQVLILQLETPIDVAVAALKLSKGPMGVGRNYFPRRRDVIEYCVSILNGAPFTPDHVPELFTLPTIFCVNEHEASQFTQLPVTNKMQAETAASKLISMGCKSVLITLGAEGAVFAEKRTGNVFYVESSKVACVDSTGAGDAFIGALAYFLVKKKELPIEEMIENACTIAADSVTRKGTQPSFSDAQVLEKLGL